MSTLNKDQQNALNRLETFVYDDTPMLILSGAAGTGKSFLLNQLANSYEKFASFGQALGVDCPATLTLTATTNKAVSALYDQITTLDEVTTIYSALGIRPQYNYDTRETKLVYKDRKNTYDGMFFVVDEYSYIDKELYDLMVNPKRMRNCKFLFVGDSCQLPPIGSDVSYIDQLNIEKIELTQIMRQANGNPIQGFSSALRDCVLNSTAIPKVPINGIEISHVDLNTFQNNLVKDLQSDVNAKYLGFTNKAVQHYNNNLYRILNSKDKGYNKGDIVMVNRYIANDCVKLKPETVTSIDQINHEEMSHNVRGMKMYIEGFWFFMPYDLSMYDSLLENADVHTATDIHETWIDVRHAYACTIHKSQGSTFNTVYIDLNDMKFIYKKDINLFKRLFYVAVSRAKERVIFTGDVR